MRVTDRARRLSLNFVGHRMPEKETESILGVVTGDYNVSDALQELDHGDEIAPDYELTFFDKPRKKLLTQVSRSDLPSKSAATSMWTAQGLRFQARKGAKYGSVEVLDVSDFLDPFERGCGTSLCTDFFFCAPTGLS